MGISVICDFAEATADAEKNVFLSSKKIIYRWQSKLLEFKVISENGGKKDPQPVALKFFR